jgi:hypothetical protein
MTQKKNGRLNKLRLHIYNNKTFSNFLDKIMGFYFTALLSNATIQKELIASPLQHESSRGCLLFRTSR